MANSLSVFCFHSMLSPHWLIHIPWDSKPSPPWCPLGISTNLLYRSQMPFSWWEKNMDSQWPEAVCYWNHPRIAKGDCVLTQEFCCQATQQGQWSQGDDPPQLDLVAKHFLSTLFSSTLSGTCRVFLAFSLCQLFLFFIFGSVDSIFPKPKKIRNHWEFTSDHHRFILPYCKVRSYKEEEQIFAVLVFC